jgi:hypothetical protein
MRRSEMNRAAWVARLGHPTVLATLIGLAVCGCSEPGDRGCQSPQRPSSESGAQFADLVEFRAEVISMIPIAEHSGKLRPVSFGPQYAVTVRLLDGVPEFSHRPGETVCLGLDSPTLTFGSNHVIGQTFRFRIFGDARSYHRVEAEKDSGGAWVDAKRQPATRVFHLPGMDVVRLAERLRSRVGEHGLGGGAIIVVGDPETEEIGV